MFFEGLTPSDWLTELATAKLFESLIQEVLVGDVVRQHRMRPYATRAMHQWQDFVHRHSSLHFVALRLDLPFVLAHYPDLNAIADPLDAARAVERKFTPLGLAC
jgi:hypothetical protein